MDARKHPVDPTRQRSGGLYRRRRPGLGLLPQLRAPMARREGNDLDRLRERRRIAFDSRAGDLRRRNPWEYLDEQSQSRALPAVGRPDAGYDRHGNIGREKRAPGSPPPNCLFMGQGSLMGNSEYFGHDLRFPHVQ